MCIDFFRKQMKTSDSNLEENSGGLEPQKELLKVRQASTINQAMESLPERQRSAVVMCHYQGLSNREAAGILDVSVDALESLLSRGRKRLRESLKGDAI
jgi:RNA polymerase sigma-70 factor (ECF subfamily)